MSLSDAAIFNRYFGGGPFSLPFLLKFSCVGCETLYFAQNNESILYNGTVYHAAGLTYTCPDSNGKGAALQINAADNTLIEFVEGADENWRLDVVAQLAEGGVIQPLKQYVHFFGTVSYTEKMELNFELGTDDRHDMTFPPYKFDSETNKGNT